MSTETTLTKIASHPLDKVPTVPGVAAWQMRTNSGPRTAAVVRSWAHSEQERCLAAQSSDVIPVVFEALADDENFHVLFDLGSADNCPLWLIEALAARNSPYGCGGAAVNRRTPPRLLRKLAANEAVGVRDAVASNVACPPELLEQLAGDTHSDVVVQVAHNPVCPPELLERLARHDDNDIREAARQCLRRRDDTSKPRD